MTKKLGLKDVPIIGKDEESLGLSDYAYALSGFIQLCETPLTIAIQGDWGSGKTSLMNLIKEDIVENTKAIKTIWFNTWQYSQFNLEDFLPFSLISYFAKELGDSKDSNVKKLLSSLLTVGKAVSIGIASAAGQGDSLKEAYSYMEQEKKIDAAMQVKELKDNLRDIVKRSIKEGHFERIVVFIDDLDRLNPEKAVDFLEVFKLFLDIEDCVFILACDYNVVMQGLKQKFGVDHKELQGKSFFDKIIQLPFSMPVGLGDRRGYIDNLLQKIDAKYESDDLEDYEELIDKSVGFNPRNMKRIFNSLLLLNLVAKRKQLYNSSAEGDLATEAEKQKILFAILCMQIAYEPLYRLFIKNKGKIDDEFFFGFINYGELIKNPKQLNDNYPHLVELQKEMNDDNDYTKMKRISRFMEQFYNCIQLKKAGDKEKLQPEEKEMLVSILSFSSITSVQVQESSSEDISDKMKLYLDFYTGLAEELSKVGLPLKRKAKAKNYLPFATGKQRTYFTINFYRNEKFGVEMTLESDKETNKKNFDFLLKNKDAIEKAFGEPLSWERMDDKRNSRIAVYRDASIYDDPNKLSEIKQWGAQTAKKFYDTLNQYVKMFD